jgi:hypothetical protein
MFTFVIIKKVKFRYFKSLKFIQLSIVVSILLPVFLNAQMDPVAISKILAKANAEITTKTSSVIGEGDYLISGDSLFLNPDGTHYLYSYNARRNTFIRHDHSNFHGHNFKRILFQFKGEIYAFGGYGFWTSHAKLIKFDKISKEWELVMIQNLDLNLFQPLHSAILGDSIYIYGTYEHHAVKINKQTTIRSFIINLRDFKCKEYQNTEVQFIEKISSASYNHQQSNFVIWGGPNSFDYILDKSKGIYYKNTSGPAFFAPNNTQKINFKDSIYRFVVGKELITVNPDYSIERLDIENYIKLFCLPENYIKDWEESTVMSKEKVILVYQIAIAILILSILIFLVLFFSRDKRLNHSIHQDHDGLDNHDSVMHTLLSIGNGEFSEKEIDMILRISHFPDYVRKIRRSQIIFDVNEKHPSLVEKIENTNKKEFVYLIHSTVN